MWCMLCLGDHQSIENPPKIAAYILPNMFNFLLRLWADEWPVHPQTTCVKAKAKMLTRGLSVVQATSQEVESKRASKI